jgi:hypothetical protein
MDAQPSMPDVKVSSFGIIASLRFNDFSVDLYFCVFGMLLCIVRFKVFSDHIPHPIGVNIVKIQVPTSTGIPNEDAPEAG